MTWFLHVKISCIISPSPWFLKLSTHIVSPVPTENERMGLCDFLNISPSDEDILAFGN